VGVIDGPCSTGFLKHHPHPGFRTPPSVYLSLILFRTFIILHRYLLIWPYQFPSLVSYSHEFFASLSGIVTFAMRYSYDTSFHYSFLLISFPLPPPLSVCTGDVLARGGRSCAHGHRLARCFAVPAVPLAILPLGVERRMCCGGERGSARSVG